MTEQQRFSSLQQELLSQERPLHVGRLLHRAAVNWPDHSAVICENQKISYGELYARACLMAQKLKELGVKPDDRVLVYYENSLDFFVAYWGIWQAGAIVAPLNVFLNEAELIRIIGDAKPAAIIVSEKLQKKVYAHPKETLPPVITTQDINEILTHKQPIQECPILDRDINGLAALLYTSGTTGFPKGVMLSSRNIITNAIQGIARFNVTAGDSVYCALPLFHSLPQNVCVWATTLLGATAIVIPKIERHLLLDGFKNNPQFVVAVPALYGLFCMMKTVPFGHIRYFFSGGDALSDKIRGSFELIYKRKLCNGYGLTETSPYIAVDLDDYTQPTNTVGRPFIGIDCSLRDNTGQEVTPGAIGTLWVKGDNVMLGYYNAPKATQAILKNGWLNTGDVAYFDKEGKIVLVGRERDLISNKGLKIYPQEIENILLSHLLVTQAAVIGIKKGDTEIPIAFIASKTEDPEALKGELKALCQQQLAAYKIPREIIIKHVLPVTVTGKVDKKALKLEYTNL